MVLALVLTTSGVIVFLALLAWYFSHIFAKVQVRCHSNALNGAILRDCPSLRARYVPHFCTTFFCGCSRRLSGGLQSYFEECDPFPDSIVREETIPLEDGGTIRIDWFEECADSPFSEDTPIVVVFPQVGYCSPNHGINAIFCKRLAGEGQFRVVQCVYQGLGGLTMSSSHIPSTAYCGTDDVGAALMTVHRTWPKASIVVLCFSIGAAHFTRFAGQNPKLCAEYRVVGMVALAHGFSAAETSRAGRSTLGGAPGRAVVYLWKDQLKKKPNLEYLNTLDGKMGFDVKRLLKASTFDEWDEAALPLYGYRSKQEMLLKCDAYNYLSGLSMPMLFVNAENDPVCPARRMVRPEHPELLDNPLAILVTTKFGGHLHWPDGCCRDSKSAWIQDVVVEYVNSVLANGSAARE
eukprot:TRINITY_DN11810_c0_g1_i1.p1 TRINITY_DN11810_c0_g1~~TRINITY_DN11810_c0_g1_i1.p1  ORF type:complete len:407 (+),score=46.19 TRINITY_DN11810_c0_g1_i1:112-1332(+)